jgi:RNA polymerase sigma-70 factor (ECF subfamily)
MDVGLHFANVRATPTPIDDVFRAERPRVLATLIRVLRDFDLAEDAAQEAFAAAFVRWPIDGVPVQPHAWLVKTAQYKAVDRIRRKAWLAKNQDELVALADTIAASPDDDAAPGGLDDDRLRLIFTCCHPALPLDAQVALTLRTVAGLTTEEIAAAFLVPAPTMGQRLVRAKAKIREAGIPYRVPDEALLPERLEATMAVVYLVFSEGYAATSGDALVRRELTAEAIRLARLLSVLLPDRGEVLGLLALLLLQDSRRNARTDEAGRIVLLDDQDRTRWDRVQIDEGLALVPQALRIKPVGPYALQAAIAALHAEAETKDATDWPQIAALYAVLLDVAPSPVIELNMAVAVAMAEGPRAGLLLLDDLVRRETPVPPHLLDGARADLLARLGQTSEARDAYDRALASVSRPAETELLSRKRAALPST